MTLTKLLKGLTPIGLIAALPSSAFAAANLQSDDFVGISFWLISMALMAATVFFLWETQSVDGKWKTSLVVSALVTFIAVYRYIDWLLTVPLLMIEFFLILRAIGNASGGIFWRLLIGTLVMLIPGYLAEAGYINATLGFVIGMLGWFYILYEIFAGEAGQMAAKEASQAVQSSYNSMRWIVTIGWAIYPLGYALGYFVYIDADGNTTQAASEALNIVYNLADVVNKIAFGLLIWYAATSESKN